MHSVPDVRRPEFRDAMKAINFTRLPVLLTLAVLLGCGGGSGGGDGSTVSVSLTAEPQTTLPGGIVTVTASVVGSSDGVTWTADEGGLSDKTPTQAVWTAPETKGDYQVRATSAEDPSRYKEITLAVREPGFVVLNPTSETIEVNRTVEITAAIVGGSGNVTWSLPSGGGTVNPTVGLTTTFTGGPTIGPVTVKATSVDDPTQSATMVVTLIAGTGGISGTIQ